MPARFPSVPVDPLTTSVSAAFGLVAWLEETRVRLPLKGVEARFQVIDECAEVEIDQMFFNERAEALDVTYTFPLPAAASVYRCELIVEGRVVAAVVEEKARAQELFEEARRAGHRAALVDTERANVFTLRLGNVQSREVVIVRLAYVQELERLLRTVSLRIPVCPGVRYIPGQPLLRANTGPGVVDDTDQVPDASRISPPRIDALHPDAAVFHLRGTFSSAAVVSGSIVSPSHGVAVREKGDALSVGFVQEDTVPDRDFILRWEQPRLAPDTARALVESHDGESTVLLRFAAPGMPAEAASTTPREVWFLVDCSASMAGHKWTQTCRALINCLEALRPDDRVFVTFFGSSFTHFAERPLTVARLLAHPNFRGIEHLGTGGGTELVPALVDVLARISAAEGTSGAAHLVILTDGQVGNEAEVRRHLVGAPELQVHTIGIDFNVNDALLQSLASDHGGRCVCITPEDSVGEAVATIVHSFAAPVVTALTLPAGLVPEQTAPTAMFAGQEFTLWAKATTALGVDLAVAGQRSDGKPWTCAVAMESSSGDTLARLYARRSIQHLERAGKSDEAVALAKRHNLLCQGVAFIAIDRASQARIATDEFYQPSLEPMPMLADRAMKMCAVPTRSHSAGHGDVGYALYCSTLSSDADEDELTEAQLSVLEALPVEMHPLIVNLLIHIRWLRRERDEFVAVLSEWSDAVTQVRNALAALRTALFAAGHDRGLGVLLAGTTDVPVGFPLEKTQPEVATWLAAARRESFVLGRVIRILKRAGLDPVSLQEARLKLLQTGLG